MLTRKAWLGLVSASAICTIWIGLAIGQGADNPRPGGRPGGQPGAQPGGPGGGPGAGQPGDRPRFDPAEMRKMMQERMKTNLGVTDDEWKVLQPKIEAVSTLRMEAMAGGGMRGMFGRGGRPGGPGGPGGGAPGEAAPRPASDQPQSETAKAGEALSKVLENKEAKPEEIKAALQALRDARTAVKAKLEKAQKELKEIVTVKQEAQFVMMGMLE